MKTHEHALISLIYGAAIAFTAGKGLSDGGIYLAALVGGELIDIIDHPLYHLVFARNDRVIAEVRANFKKSGFQAGVRSLYEKEDERSYNKMRLHNVFSLTLIALTAIFASLLMPGPVYSFVLLGAFLLHMLTDIYGDFKLLGHFDNWLWILPPRAITWLGERGKFLVWITLLWFIDILTVFFLVSFRSFWQFLSNSDSFLTGGLSAEAAKIGPGELWITYTPLLILLFYFGLILVLVIAEAHKINLETPVERRGKRSRFSTQSLKSIGNFTLHKPPHGQNRLEQILLAMQADLAVWNLIVTILIAGLITFEKWININFAVILMTPMVLALIFGTLVHTSIGEFSGVQGAILGTFLILISPNQGTDWFIREGYQLFIAALGAWLLGLLGGIVLSGHKKMSLVAFVIRVESRDDNANGKELRHLINIAHQGLEAGYRQTHKILQGEDQTKLSVIEPPVDFLIAPRTGGPAMSGDHYHLKIQDQISPILQNMSFILCSNRLTSHNQRSGKFGLMPTLPRTRVLTKDPRNVDLLWKDGNYIWDSAKTGYCLPSCENANSWLEQDQYLGLIKTWGELFDDLLTAKWIFNTDLYIFPTPENLCSMTICGISRATTSTKEYATIETELYTSEVMKSIQEIAQQMPDFTVTESQSARVIFPRLAFDDQKTTTEIYESAVFPAYFNECFSRESVSLITRALKLIPGGDRIFKVSERWNWIKRLAVLGGQLAGSIAISLYLPHLPNLGDPNFDIAIKTLLQKIF